MYSGGVGPSDFSGGVEPFGSSGGVGPLDFSGGVGPFGSSGGWGHWISLVG